MSMKARVFKIFKDNKHHISYTHVSPPKCHDDVKSVDHRIYYTPMMEICLFNGDGSLDKESVCTFASPEVIKAFSGFDMFNAAYMFSIEHRDLGVIDIEFDWVEGVYPYLKVYDSCDSLVVNEVHSPIQWYEWNDSNIRPLRSDYVLSDKTRFPKISEILDIPFYELMD